MYIVYLCYVQTVPTLYPHNKFAEEGTVKNRESILDEIGDFLPL